jgi:hypothetical protein
MARPQPITLRLELPTGSLLHGSAELAAGCGMPAAGEWIALAIDPRRLALLPAQE